MNTTNPLPLTPFSTAFTDRVAKLFGVKNLGDLKAGDAFYFQQSWAAAAYDPTRPSTFWSMFFLEGVKHELTTTANAEKFGLPQESVTFNLSGGREISVSIYPGCKTDFLWHENGDTAVRGPILFGKTRTQLCDVHGNPVDSQVG